jgi:hypothetical protein
MNAPIRERFGCLTFFEPAPDMALDETYRPDDPVDFEALQNKLHLDEFVPWGTSGVTSWDWALMMELGRALVTAWAERIEPLLCGRTVLFYLGGDSSCTVRFHVDRRPEHANWLDTDDSTSLETSRIELWSLSTSGLKCIRPVAGT